MNKSKTENGQPTLQQHNVSGSYKILDKDGIEMPDHYSGRRRTYEEAKKMVDNLNKNGEYRPYTVVEV
jgi:hypothetical protein